MCENGHKTSLFQKVWKYWSKSLRGLVPHVLRLRNISCLLPEVKASKNFFLLSKEINETITLESELFQLSKITIFLLLNTKLPTDNIDV